LKPVACALDARGLAPTLIFTGQHPELNPSEFGLERFPRLALSCAGRENPHEHVEAVTRALCVHLFDQPDLVVVQGDTSSALGGALAAFMAGIPVAHVEAGLRTHDPNLPWPEEEYRSAIDAEADLLFAPTELAAANLRAEKVPGEIHVTGNTSIDAVLEAESRLPPPTCGDRSASRVLVTCHRRESWSEGLRSIAAAIIDLTVEGLVRVEVILHPNVYVAATMRSLLASVPGVTLVQPLGHDELLARMRDCDLVLSDSGGIQEEAPALGVPLLVLRDKTERPEGIAAGTARLVGTDRSRIVSEAKRILTDPEVRAAMSRRSFPFGDGCAAFRIAEIIDGWLEERSLTRRLA
jgi:UDP-N-acetylglucosamine 2-epimerase (non-hydrolysing)